MDTKFGYLFDGQGAFVPGFGKQYINHSVFRVSIQSISDLADMDIANLILGAGSTMTTEDQVNLQVALFALNYSLAKLFEDYYGEPFLVAGHSLGELCALIYAKSFSLNDGGFARFRYKKYIFA